MGVMEHARRELKALGYDPDDTEEGPDKWIQENVLELLEVFAKQGHSGSSAPYLVRLFADLAMYKPLRPLTGEDSEWRGVEGGMQQNLRCSRVFRGEGGEAYDIEGIIFREPDGACYSGHGSRVRVTFPYTPTVRYVDVGGGFRGALRRAFLAALRVVHLQPIGGRHG